MTSRISIGNGHYCYSGPTCRLHGAQLSKEARRDIQKAVIKVDAAVNTYDIIEAKYEMVQALIAYDATTDGQNALTAILQNIRDDKYAIRLPYIRRYRTAKAYVKTFERIAKINKNTTIDENGLVALVFDDNNSYNEKIIPNIKNGFKRFIYEVAADISRDIKDAQEKDYLPKGIVCEVEGTDHLKDSQIKINVQNVRDDDIYEQSPTESYQLLQTAQAQELRRRIDVIVAPYNSDSHNSEIDYIPTYYHVNIETERDREYRLSDPAWPRPNADSFESFFGLSE